MFAIDTPAAAATRFMEMFGAMAAIGLIIAIVVGLLIHSVQNNDMDRRYRMAKEDPEAYKAASAWEQQKQQQIRQDFEKQGETAKKAAVVAGKGAETLLKMLFKK